MTLWESFVRLLTAIFRWDALQPEVPEPPPAKLLRQCWLNSAPPDQNDVIIKLLNAHNNQRANAGVPALALNEKLNNAARSHADWMALNRNMSHNEVPNTPDFSGVSFSERVLHQGYTPRLGGENIAAGQEDVDEVMTAWMGSDGHRANILSTDYWNCGFGSAHDEFGHTYWVAVFATPLTRAQIKTRLIRLQVRVRMPRALVKR